MAVIFRCWPAILAGTIVLSCGPGARREIVSVRMLQRNLLRCLHMRGGPLLRSAAAFAMVAMLISSCTVSRELDDLTAGCPDGTKFCGDECVAIDDPDFGCSADSCDRCEERTNATRMSCSNGECVVTRCDSGAKLCDGECRRLDLPEFGCNRPGCAPCIFERASNYACSAFGACEITNCNRGWADCDGKTETGCEINTNERVDHCGECRIDCQALYPTVPRGIVSCGAGACVIGGCDTGYKNCNGLVRDGCERHVQTDNNNCGVCGKKCTADQTCTDGVCEP